jgi:hypothetical protein
MSSTDEGVSSPGGVHTVAFTVSGEELTVLHLIIAGCAFIVALLVCGIAAFFLLRSRWGRAKLQLPESLDKGKETASRGLQNHAVLENSGALQPASVRFSDTAVPGGQLASTNKSPASFFAKRTFFGRVPNSTNPISCCCAQFSSWRWNSNSLQIARDIPRNLHADDAVEAATGGSAGTRTSATSGMLFTSVQNNITGSIGASGVTQPFSEQFDPKPPVESAGVSSALQGLSIPAPSALVPAKIDQLPEQPTAALQQYFTTEAFSRVPPKVSVIATDSIPGLGAEPGKWAADAAAIANNGPDTTSLGGVQSSSLLQRPSGGFSQNSLLADAASHVEIGAKVPAAKKMTRNMFQSGEESPGMLKSGKPLLGDNKWNFPGEAGARLAEGMVESSSMLQSNEGSGVITDVLKRGNVAATTAVASPNGDKLTGLSQQMKDSSPSLAAAASSLNVMSPVHQASKDVAADLRVGASDTYVGHRASAAALFSLPNAVPSSTSENERAASRNWGVPVDGADVTERLIRKVGLSEETVCRYDGEVADYNMLKGALAAAVEGSRELSCTGTAVATTGSVVDSDELENVSARGRREIACDNRTDNKIGQASQVVAPGAVEDEASEDEEVMCLLKELIRSAPERPPAR